MNRPLRQRRSMAFVVAVVTALVAISAAPPRPGTSPSSNPTSTPATSPLTVGGRGAMPPRPIHGAAYQSTNELDGQPVRILPLRRVIASKEAAGRDKDLAVLPVLRRTLALAREAGRRGRPLKRSRGSR